MSLKLVITTIAVLAALSAPALANEFAPSHQGHHARTAVAPWSSVGPTFDEGARAAYGSNLDFAGWPTDYLSSRFGDRQAQGGR